MYNGCRFDVKKEIPADEEMMLRIWTAAFIALLALITTGAIGCGQRGQGTNIAEGKSCLAGDPKSTCATGFYCAPTGMETEKGGTYSSPGLCMKQKTANQSCTFGNQDECAAPLHCSTDNYCR